MRFFRVVSNAVRSEAPSGYKGIYRLEADFQNDDEEEIHHLWYRYVKYYESRAPLGVTDELKVDELLHFCEMLNKKRNVAFEVICIENELNGINDSVFYGIDVSSIGGYSMIGEGFFKINTKDENSAEIVCNINRFFDSRLNRYGLFQSMSDAQMFLDVLRDFQANNLIEHEEYYIWYISRVGN